MIYSKPIRIRELTMDMKTVDKNDRRNLKRFDDVPDIIDPNFSNYLQQLIKKEFGNASWHVKMYIADDGTGSISVVSRDDSHGQSYRESEVLSSADAEPDDTIVSWTKRVRWKWNQKHPEKIISFKTMDTDGEFAIEERVLYRYDMSDWKDTLVYGEMKQSNTTTEMRDTDGNQNVDFGWQRGTRSGDNSMQNIRDEDTSADSIPTDEISVTFSQAYEIWINSIRPRMNVGSDVPRPFDCKGKSERKLVSMIEHFDKRLIEIKEHNGADAGNINNYIEQFSEVREAYHYMDKNLNPQSTYRKDNFEENWTEFKSKMDVLIELLSSHSSRL